MEMFLVVTSINTKEVLENEPGPDYDQAKDVQSMREALQTSFAKDWEKANDSEFDSMATNNVIRVVDYEPWMEPLVDSKLVFKIKRNTDGSLDKFKVRWVARGFSEIQGRPLD